MNYRSENQEQCNTALKNLVESNMDAMDTLEMVPYQPIVYAVPEDIRNAEMDLLREAVGFQPRLYELIEEHATRKELEDYCSEMEKKLEFQNEEILREVGNRMDSAVNALTSENLKTVKLMQDCQLQAGKDQGEFISKISAEFARQLSELKSVIEECRQREMKFLLRMGIASIALSLLVCIIFWKSVT